MLVTRGMCLLAVPYLVNAVLDYTPALDTNVLTEATNNNSSLKDDIMEIFTFDYVI